ncbi:MAG: hypothetical protein FJ150_10400 [Euryarchaeota archaeon]|nr:hypothetical protein [Euryarchaeota archaeon]
MKFTKSNLTNMEKKFGNFLDEFIKERVADVLENREIPEEPAQYIETDNLAEVVEKLVILHIRMWMLEDTMREAVTDEEIALIKKKCDICFKVKRPRYVEAVNLMVDNAIESGRSLREDSVKLYKG